MCCDGWELTVDESKGESLDECHDCGTEVVRFGSGEAAVAAKVGCNYSPITCHTCGARPCDQSC